MGRYDEVFLKFIHSLGKIRKKLLNSMRNLHKICRQQIGNGKMHIYYVNYAQFSIM